MGGTDLVLTLVGASSLIGQLGIDELAFFFMSDVSSVDTRVYREKLSTRKLLNFGAQFSGRLACIQIRKTYDSN